MRDALLPYVFFRSRGRDNIYPWQISRRFLEDITETEYVDDDIRLPLYEALESGQIQFDDYSAYCKERILSVLNEHPKLKTRLPQKPEPDEKGLLMKVTVPIKRT